MIKLIEFGLSLLKQTIIMEISDFKNEFLKEFMQINNREIIINLKNFLDELKNKQENNTDWLKFAGIWTKEKANEISEIIKYCENIDFKKIVETSYPTVKR